MRTPTTISTIRPTLCCKLITQKMPATSTAMPTSAKNIYLVYKVWTFHLIYLCKLRKYKKLGAIRLLISFKRKALNQRFLIIFSEVNICHINNFFLAVNSKPSISFGSASFTLRYMCVCVCRQGAPRIHTYTPLYPPPLVSILSFINFYYEIDYVVKYATSKIFIKYIFRKYWKYKNIYYLCETNG